MLGKRFWAHHTFAVDCYVGSNLRGALLYYKNAVACFYADEAAGLVDAKDYEQLLAVCNALSEVNKMLEMPKDEQFWRKYSKSVMGEYDSKKRNSKIREEFLKLSALLDSEAEAKSDDEEGEEFSKNAESSDSDDDDVPKRVLPKEPLPIKRKAFSSSEEKNTEIPRDYVAIHVLLQQRAFQKKHQLSPPRVAQPKKNVPDQKNPLLRRTKSKLAPVQDDGQNQDRDLKGQVTAQAEPQPPRSVRESAIPMAGEPKLQAALGSNLPQRSETKIPDVQPPKEKPKEQFKPDQLRLLKEMMQRPNPVPPGMLVTNKIVAGVVKHSTIINTSRHRKGSGCVMSGDMFAQASLGAYQAHRGSVPVCNVKV